MKHGIRRNPLSEYLRKQNIKYESNIDETIGNPRVEFDLLLAKMENFLCQIVHCLSRLRPLAFNKKIDFSRMFFFCSVYVRLIQITDHAFVLDVVVVRTVMLLFAK